jgi:murein DD-endopeptidase MepM/ murein hydrolase activator NlpD
MSRRLGMVLAALVGVLVAVSAGASAPPATVVASSDAAATAVQVETPDAKFVAADVAAPPAAAAPKAAFSYPADASIVSAATTVSGVNATTSPATAAKASAEVTGLSLFAGEITAQAVTVKVAANATTANAKADFVGTRVVGLQVLGAPVAGEPGTVIPLADWGRLSLLTETAQPGSKSGAPRFSISVAALQVELLADHGGLPAGSKITIGYAESFVQGATPELQETTTSRPPVTTFAPPVTTPEPADQGKPKRKRGPGLSLDIPTRQPSKVHPPLTAGGYVFPIYGPSSFIDSFGAARADVSWHHGDDIFAPLGAPLLAVADGTLFSVGWNDIGGLRLWLRDGAGNEFYYAHLSALSTKALDGAVVQAGDVIGFVGNTGDAKGTPYHLHFEIHPVSQLYLGYDGAVDPTKYLQAWQRLQDVPIEGVVGWAPPLGGAAPKAVAILLQASDISTASGLDPGSLRRAVSAAGHLRTTGRSGSGRGTVPLVPARPLDRG